MCIRDRTTPGATAPARKTLVNALQELERERREKAATGDHLTRPQVSVWVLRQWSHTLIDDTPSTVSLFMIICQGERRSVQRN